MRNFKIKVYFKKDILIQPEIVLVRNDYNSTEFEFEFDIEEGKKIFELKKPDGTVFVKDIVDNKIILVDYDEESNIIPVINQPGEYNFEIVCYDENSKITASQKGKFSARDEVVDLDEDKLSEDARLPILDSLINQTMEVSKESKEQGDYAKKQGDYAKEQGNYAKKVASNIESKVTNGDFNGATFTPSIDKEGNISWTNDKGLDNPSSSNIMGPQGPQGIQGEAFTIKKTYSSKEEMNNDFDNMQIGDYVMITSNVELEDNAKMYSRGQDEWIFITDFSGATGIQGPQGIQGIQGIQGPKGDKGDKPIKCVDYFTETDKNEMVSSITDDANSEFNINANEKLAEYNQNHEEKVQEYNSNAETKVNEFNNEVDTLKDELNDCYNNQLVGQAEGTSVYINDSADARMRGFKIDGNLKQETTTGKNLFDFQDVRGNISSSTSIDNDNFITIKYDNSEDTNFKYINYFTNKSDRLEINRNYAIFLEIKNVSGNGSICITSSNQDANRGQFKTGKSYNFSGLNNNQVYKFVGTTFESFETSVSMLRTYVAFDGGQSGSITFRISVLEDTTITPENFVYEKYTGGQSSPNPEYPQEIEVLEAPNILPYPYTETSKTVNGITFTDNEDGTITLNGTATSDAKFALYGSQNIDDQKSILGEYICSGINNNIRVQVVHRENNNFHVLAISTGNLQKIDLSTYQNGYIEIKVLAGTSCDNVVVKPMLTKTNNIKNYIPLGCIQTKVTNRNLIKNELISKTVNGVTVTVNKNKSISLRGTVGQSFTLYLFKEKQSFLKENAEYTLSHKGILPKGAYFRIQNSNNTDLFYGVGVKDNSSNNSLTFIHNKNLNDKIDCIIWFGSYSVGQEIDFTLYPQLEEGNEETEYIPYQEETIDINLQGNFVAKLTDEIKDTLRIENGHAILNKKVDKERLMSNNVLSFADEYKRFSWININSSKSIGSEYVKSNFAICKTNTTVNAEYKNTIIPRGRENGGHILYVWLDNVTNIDEAKEFLDNNEMYVYYILKEPYDVDLGTVKLPKIFKGVSNIFLNANLETNMQVDYVKDTQLVIDDLQSQIDNINTLLSTTNTSALLLDNLQSDLESEVI